MVAELGMLGAAQRASCCKNLPGDSAYKTIEEVVVGKRQDSGRRRWRGWEG